MKSPAPLLSLNPSGTFAGLITASIWKGRNYIRQRVDPSNPQTAGQQAVRQAVALISGAALGVLTSFKDIADVGSPFFVYFRDAAPSGQSWISKMQGTMISQAADASTNFAGLSGTIQGYFNNTAADCGIVDLTPVPGSSFASTAAGAQLYLLAQYCSTYATGTLKTTADTAIVGGSQGDVDDFGDLVHLTV